MKLTKEQVEISITAAKQIQKYALENNVNATDFEWFWLGKLTDIWGEKSEVRTIGPYTTFVNCDFPVGEPASVYVWPDEPQKINIDSDRVLRSGVKKCGDYLLLVGPCVGVNKEDMKILPFEYGNSTENSNGIVDSLFELKPEQQIKVRGFFQKED